MSNLLAFFTSACIRTQKTFIKVASFRLNNTVSVFDDKQHTHIHHTMRLHQYRFSLCRAC